MGQTLVVDLNNALSNLAATWDNEASQALADVAKLDGELATMEALV